MVLEDVHLIGSPRPDLFAAFLQQDECFGCYSPSSEECANCRCPVIVSGSLLLLKEFCQHIAKGSDATAGTIRRLDSREVFDRVCAQVPVKEIWLEILNGCDPEVRGREARQVLKDRLYYLRTERGELVPDVPTFKELLDE